VYHGGFGLAQPPDFAPSALIKYFSQIARIYADYFLSPLLVFSPTGSKCRSVRDKTLYFLAGYLKGCWVRLLVKIPTMGEPSSGAFQKGDHYGRSQPEA
jgi:hypothetical protein